MGADPQIIQQTQTTIPTYAEPYVTRMLGRAEAATNQPYQYYPGQRFANVDPLTQQAYNSVANMGLGAQAGNSLESMYNLARQAGTSSYGPSTYGNQYQSQGAYNPTNFGYQNVTGAAANAAQLGNAPTYQGQQLNYTPQNFSYDRVNAPNLQNLQMQAARDVGTRSFTQPGSAQAYMSPYMQNVVDIQQREAQRQADIAGTKRGAGFAQAGAFGGSRQAIENAEAARNLATQKGDIQAQGLQSAYQSAQGQFNTEQQAALNAALANQQVQQQTGIQNLSAALQTQGLGAQTGLTAQQLNQAAGMQTGQFNANQQYNTALQNAQLSQQQQLANQGLLGQYGLQQGQFGQAANLQNAQLQQQANLANQQAGMTTQQQQELARQYGYGQQMVNAANAAQYGQAANQLNEQSRQYGAGYGLQALQSGMQGMQNYGNLSGLYNQQGMNIYNAQNQMGQQAQNYQQQQYTQNYNDFVNQRDYPIQQLGQFSNILRGLPLAQTSMAQYQQAPSMASQLAGFGTAALGVSQLGKTFGGAKGGMIRTAHGLPALAISQMG
jgi:hypothetical protein